MVTLGNITLRKFARRKKLYTPIEFRIIDRFYLHFFKTMF